MPRLAQRKGAQLNRVMDESITVKSGLISYWGGNFSYSLRALANLAGGKERAPNKVARTAVRWRRLGWSAQGARMIKCFNLPSQLLWRAVIARSKGPSHNWQNRMVTKCSHCVILWAWPSGLVFLTTLWNSYRRKSRTSWLNIIQDLLIAGIPFVLEWALDKNHSVIKRRAKLLNT